MKSGVDGLVFCTPYPQRKTSEIISPARKTSEIMVFFAVFDVFRAGLKVFEFFVRVTLLILLSLKADPNKRATCFSSTPVTIKAADDILRKTMMFTRLSYCRCARASSCAGRRGCLRSVSSASVATPSNVPAASATKGDDPDRLNKSKEEMRLAYRTKKESPVSGSC